MSCFLAELIGVVSYRPWGSYQKLSSMGLPAFSRPTGRGSQLLCGHPDPEYGGFQSDPDPLMSGVVEPVALLRQGSLVWVFLHRPTIEQPVALPAHRRRRMAGFVPNLQGNLQTSVVTQFSKVEQVSTFQTPNTAPRLRVLPPRHHLFRPPALTKPPQQRLQPTPRPRVP